MVPQDPHAAQRAATVVTLLDFRTASGEMTVTMEGIENDSAKISWNFSGA